MSTKTERDIAFDDKLFEAGKMYVRLYEDWRKAYDLYGPMSNEEHDAWNSLVAAQKLYNRLAKRAMK